MSVLAPNLFQRRFPDLLEIGRARLRYLAPEWTDHNAHDPGVTLVELLAWVAEAQLYSLSRMRRDERLAYAALLGLAPSGTSAARGLLWNDPLDPSSPASTFARSVVVPVAAVVHVQGADDPTFRPSHPVLWVPGRIVKLETRTGLGRSIDHTSTNARGGPAFLPLGERAGRNDVLAITFACRDDEGLFGSNRERAKGARLSIGVRAAATQANGLDREGGRAGGAEAPPHGSAGAPACAGSRRSPLAATIVVGNRRTRLPIVEDTTSGLVATGALLLDVDEVTGSPTEWTLEVSAPGGVARPPRVLSIQPNVIPIVQGRTIARELHVATGQPDWSFALDVPGLRFDPSAEPVVVEVGETNGVNTWKRQNRLDDRGPDDRGYTLDAATGRLTFGNGLNGRIPPAESQVLVTYAVSDGEEGRVARNRQWQVQGFAGTFGVNPDPVSGGAAPFGWIDHRRTARHRSRTDHALVSAADIEAAARALPLVDVARAWVVPSSPNRPRTGTQTLVVMRSRVDGREPARVPETGQWLDAIRRQLSGRMPLGIRLAVVAPRYVEFAVQATVEVDPGIDPANVKTAIEEALVRRLALVESREINTVRQPGVPVTARDVTSWVKTVAGVRRVTALQLVLSDGRRVTAIAVTPAGLPRFLVAQSAIQAARPQQGGAA